MATRERKTADGHIVVANEDKLEERVRQLLVELDAEGDDDGEEIPQDPSR